MVNLSLKRLVISSFPSLFLALIFPVLAQENGGAGTVPFSASAYRAGERLTYNVSFSSFPSAAHVEVQVLSRGLFFGRYAFQLRAHVETSGVVNVALFSINKDFTTYVDPESGLPFRAQEVVHDAAKSADDFQDFNQPAGTIAAPARQAVVPGTYEFVSAFFRARALPLSDGAIYNFLIRGASGDYQTELKVIGRESIKTNVGSFNTIVAQIRIANNSPLKNFKVYFSDDERHVPVLLTGRISTGELRAELAGSEFIRPAAGSASTPPPVPIATPTPVPSPSPLASPTPRTTAGNENWPFAIKEQLNYQVFVGSGNEPMGIATFQVRERSRYFDRDGLFLTVKAETTGAAARLFVAHDQIDSYVDPKALLPYRTVLNLAEGKRRLNQTLIINQEYGTATTDKGQKIEMPVGTHDYLSFFYAVRTFNLGPPKRNAISILVENKPKTLFISSLKRETILLGKQKVPAIALSLTTDDAQSDKYQLRLWVSDDKRRLPLRITATTEIGPVRADLVIIPADWH